MAKSKLQIESMSKLYIEELQIASAAANGSYEGKQPGDGDHTPKRSKRRREDELLDPSDNGSRQRV